MRFTHLNVQTNFAMNGSTIRVNELVTTAVSMGYRSLAVTDAKMYGALKFYRACKEAGIKPIIGLTIQIEGIVEESVNTYLLYAKNNNGYQNILRIASYAAHKTVTLTQMKRHKEGIVAVLKTDQSELISAYKNRQTNSMMEFFTMLDDHFEDIFLSVSAHSELHESIPESYPLIAVPEVLYLKQEDADVYNVLSQILNGSNESILGTETPRHFLTIEEVQSRYKKYPEALENTALLADMCVLEMEETNSVLPSFPVANNVTSQAYLRALVYKGLDKRLRKQKRNKQQYIDRIEHELNVIHSMGYDDYFLIVYDFVKYAKQKKYLVGPGRGSAAASLVSYCLGITNVDSLAFDLVFERFLNPQRITLPDIDMDLPDDKRDDVIAYVRDKYGRHRVASICTFGTFLSKSAIRDTARIVGVDGVLLQEIIKPTEQYETIDDMIKSSTSIQNMMKQNPLAKQLLTIAARIEGLHRHVSTHAAGIILTEDEMMNYTAVQPGLLDMFQTQYEAKDLESLGLLKIDFLGLRNLTSIDRITSMIEEKEGTVIDVYKIPLDDEPTFELLRRVETTGLFQLESKGMRRLIGDMQIRRFDDIVTCLALFRPGPMENIPTYLDRRFERETVSYPDPILKDILEPTNGIIIYQEQIIQIASLFAGYSPGEADLLRRAVSKKQEDVLQEERKNFMDKARQMGRDDQTSNLIYDYIVKFANYGFNKAHSVAYAMVSYWMAYLKANYPKYFISVLTTSVIGSVRLMREYILEANKLGVSILPPNINKSTAIFEPDDMDLVYPLLGIKFVGINAVQAIIEERENGAFESFVDFIKRCHTVINKRVMESLILAGALDAFGYTRKTMMNQLENVINFTQYGNFIEQDEFVMENVKEYSYQELETYEQQMLGFNLFVNPLNEHQEYIQKHQLLTPSDFTEKHLNQEVRFVAMVTSVRSITTKNNKPMAFVTVSDSQRAYSGVLFTRTYEACKDDLEEGSVYLFKGKLEERSNEWQIIINNIHKLTK